MLQHKIYMRMCQGMHIQHYCYVRNALLQLCNRVADRKC